MKINLTADPCATQPFASRGRGGSCGCSLLGCSGSVTLGLFGCSRRAESKNKDFLFQRKSQGRGVSVVARGLLLAQLEWDTLSLCHLQLLLCHCWNQSGRCWLCGAILILAGGSWAGRAFGSQRHVSCSRCLGFLSR